MIIMKKARSLSTIWYGSRAFLDFIPKCRCVTVIEVAIRIRLPNDSAGRIKAALTGQSTNADPTHNPKEGMLNAVIMPTSRRNSGMQYIERMAMKELSAVISRIINTERVTKS